MVSVLLFLNELSCGGDASPRDADQAMVEWVELLRHIHQMRRDIALVSDVSLSSTELMEGYYIQQWISSEPKNRDRWRFVRAIQNRAPFSSVAPEVVDGDVEYEHRCRPARGLGAAHLADGLGLSLGIDQTWKDPHLTLTRSTLMEDSAGELILAQDAVEVRHAAVRDHANHHREWIQRTGKDDLTSGRIIWQSREAHFPHLTFLPRVESDLADLSPAWVRPVSELLFKLEQAVADWEPARSRTPCWGTKVTPESDSRRSLCEFQDVDGVVRVFELHARFTPGPGRLHFRLVPLDRTLRVAFIGRKIGA